MVAVGQPARLTLGLHFPYQGHILCALTGPKGLADRSRLTDWHRIREAPAEESPAPESLLPGAIAAASRLLFAHLRRDRGSAAAFAVWTRTEPLLPLRPRGHSSKRYARTSRCDYMHSLDKAFDARDERWLADHWSLFDATDGKPRIEGKSPFRRYLRLI